MNALETLIPVSQRPIPCPEGEHAVCHLTADVRDRPRNKPLVRMKVRNRCTKLLQVGFWMVPPGEHEITCYADEVDGVKGMVEDKPDQIRAAQDAYRRNIVSEVKEKYEQYRGDVVDLMKDLDAGKTDPEILDVLKRVLEGSTESVEAVFMATMKRDVRALDSAEVVPGSEHKEPKLLEQEHEKNQLADAMGAALGRFLSQPQPAQAAASSKK